MKDKVKAAIIGAGYMAREHALALAAMPEVELVGILDRARAEALAREADIPRVFGSVTELAEKTGAELVIMAVPELAARQVAEETFEFPWVVLAEKPLGYNLDQAEEITSLAEARGRRVFVALNRRHYSSTKAALDWLDQDQGRRYIQVRDQQSHQIARQVGQPELVVENWMYANSVHLVDYLTLLGRGEVDRVEVLEPYRGEESTVVLAKVSFSSGDIGLYEAIWQGPGPWAVTVTTANRRYEMRPLEEGRYQLAGERSLNPIEIDPWDKEFKAGVRAQAEKAVAEVLGRKTDLPTAAEALKSMRLVRAIYNR